MESIIITVIVVVPLSCALSDPVLSAQYSQPPDPLNLFSMGLLSSFISSYQPFNFPLLLLLREAGQPSRPLGPHSVSPLGLPHSLGKQIVVNHFLPGPETQSILDNMHRCRLPTDLFRWDKLQINFHFFQAREKGCLVTQGAPVSLQQEITLASTFLLR